MKSLILLNFTHLFITLQITDDILNNSNRLLFNLIWDCKVDKIYEEQMCGTYLSGGFKTTNILWLKNS